MYFTTGCSAAGATAAALDQQIAALLQLGLDLNKANLCQAVMATSWSVWGAFVQAVHMVLSLWWHLRPESGL
jgi:hypothetical protein